MSSDSIVFPNLLICDIADLLKRGKQIGIQNIFAIVSIEALNIRILSWLAWFNKGQASSTSCISDHSAKALEINSDPLYIRICLGSPLHDASIFRTRIIRRAGRE